MTRTHRLQGLLPVALVLALAACSPQQVADNVTRRAAETVVQPVLDDYMTGPEAQTATSCLLDNATPAEIQTLARDVAVVAGTSTVATVLGIAARAPVQACFAAAGLPPVPAE